MAADDWARATADVTTAAFVVAHATVVRADTPRPGVRAAQIPAPAG